MSDIVERLEAEAKAWDWRADYLTAPSRAANPHAEIEADYCSGRAALAREAAAEITCLRSLVEEAGKVVEPFAEVTIHLHPKLPDDGLTLDGLLVRDFRAARSLLDKMKEV